MPKNSAATTSKNGKTNANAGWLARQTGDDERRRLYEQERLVAWVGEEIAAALEDAEMTRADLARELGTSRAYITRVLQGSSNLTLRSLSDFACAMGTRVSLGFEPRRQKRRKPCPKEAAD